MALAALLFGVGVLHYAVGIRTNVQLAVAIDDEGTRINTLLVTDTGAGRYGELLAQDEAGPDVEQTLHALRFSLVVKDGTDVIYSRGMVRDSEGRFVDIALPGLRKGTLGIDAE